MLCSKKLSAHNLADKAEAVRVDGLRQLLTDQFSVINERLDSLGALRVTSVAPPIKLAGLRQFFSGPSKGRVSACLQSR